MKLITAVWPVRFAHGLLQFSRKSFFGLISKQIRHIAATFQAKQPHSWPNPTKRPHLDGTQLTPSIRQNIKFWGTQSGHVRVHWDPPKMTQFFSSKNTSLAIYFAMGDAFGAFLGHMIFWGGGDPNPTPLTPHVAPPDLTLFRPTQKFRKVTKPWPENLTGTWRVGWRKRKQHLKRTTHSYRSPNQPKKEPKK